MGDQVSSFLAVMCHHFKVNRFPFLFLLHKNPVSSGQGWLLLPHILQHLNTALCLKSLATFMKTPQSSDFTFPTGRNLHRGVTKSIMKI